MFRAIISPILRSTRLFYSLWHKALTMLPASQQQAASLVHYATSRKHSLVLLRMGEIIVRNMLSWLKLWIKLLLLHLVGSLCYYKVMIFAFVPNTAIPAIPLSLSASVFSPWSCSELCTLAKHKSQNSKRPTRRFCRMADLEIRGQGVDPLSWTAAYSGMLSPHCVCETVLAHIAGALTTICQVTVGKSYAYWTFHHCDSWRIRNQLDVTIY